VSSIAGGGPNLEPPQSLRAEQVAQTRAALVRAGRRLFGERGYANTSVEDLAREARVTTGALYHHFSTKTLLFEAVFLEAHAEVLAQSAQHAFEATDPIDVLALGFDVFLDAVLRPDVQRILVVDGPAVLGLTRFTELDERDAFGFIVAFLEEAVSAGQLEIEDPGTITRLIFGALTRGAMLIAGSQSPGDTRRAVSNALRSLLGGLAPRKG
jgi:AcrR family transcriptional regulator